MSRDRTWSQIIQEYNSGRILNEDGTPIYEYREFEGKDPEGNLRYCPNCKSIYERRYEQDVGKTVIYRYSALYQWDNTPFQVVPDDRRKCCGGEDCSCEGDEYVINY